MLAFGDGGEKWIRWRKCVVRDGLRIMNSKGPFNNFMQFKSNEQLFIHFIIIFKKFIQFEPYLLFVRSRCQWWPMAKLFIIQWTINKT